MVTFSSAPRSVARRSGVPIQHSAPAASIAARPASVRVVTRTACPSSTIAAARRLPRQPPADDQDPRHGARILRAVRHGARAPRAPGTLDYHPLPAMTEPSPTDSRRRDDGEDRRAVQAARLRVPLLGDLRRRRLDLRLRPLRRAAEEQRQERVVARDAAGARRHRGDRLGDPPAPARVGGLGPPRRLHRPARRLPHVRPALPRRPPRRARLRAQTVQAPGRDRRVRPDRRARLQPDVRDDDRAGEGVRRDRLPAPGDRAGHLHQLQERAAVLAQEAAVRDRAGRQVLPQRDHARATSSSARASSSRWRWSSSCRPRRPQQWFEHWLAERERWYVELGIRPDHLRLRAHDADELSHYSSAHQRRRVPVPDRLVGARGDRQPRRLRPDPARGVLGREARVLRPGDRRALRAARDRAGGGRRPRDARVPRGRLRRGTGRARGRRRGRDAHRPAPAPAPGAGQGRRCCRWCGKDGQPELAREVHRALRDARAGRVRRGRRDRPALPPPGRDRHAVVPDDRPSEPRGRHRDAARPRLARAGAPADRGHRRGDRAAGARAVEHAEAGPRVHIPHDPRGGQWTST